MAIRFIIDSASDILPDEAARLGLIHLPLTVLFGDEEYADAVTLTHRGFYEKLFEGDTLPTTCQIPPGVFAAAYEQVVAAGDTAIVVTLSGKLSGTYQSAVIAAEDYEGRVYVVDSRNVSLGERVLVLRGLELVAEGLDAATVAATLERERDEVRVLALLDTLEYLKRGGRISAATALAGGLLSIKPVVACVDGEVVLVGKARGSKQGNNLLRELVLSGGGIDFARPLFLAYSGLSDAGLQKYIADSADLWAPYTDTLPTGTVGCAIGAHVGPGAVTVAFFEKQK